MYTLIAIFIAYCLCSHINTACTRYSNVAQILLYHSAMTT